MHVYELQIHINYDGERQYYVDHRFTQLPDRETVVMLRDEALETFDALWPGEEVDGIMVLLEYLSHQERRESQREAAKR